MPAHDGKNRTGLFHFWVSGIFLVGLIYPGAEVWGQVKPISKNGRSNIPVQVSVDPRVELMSILFHLAGNPEYQDGNSSYTQEIKKYFEPYQDHLAVKYAAALRKNDGVAYDAVINLAVNITDAFQQRELVPFDQPPEGWDPRWKPEEARLFLTETRLFVKDTKFDEFLKRHQKLYRVMTARMKDMLRKEGNLAWFNRFFGPQPGVKYHIALNMVKSPSGTGACTRDTQGRKDMYCVVSISRCDREGIPVYGGLMPLIVHEFCHSYTNPLVNEYMDELAPSGKAIFPYVRSDLRKLAYGSWQTMMYESLVRACVVRYLLNTEGETAAQSDIERNRRLKFIWIGELANLLGKYESHRNQYRTLKDFFPRIVEYFNTHKDQIIQRLQTDMKSDSGQN